MTTTSYVHPLLHYTIATHNAVTRVTKNKYKENFVMLQAIGII